ncbi:Smr/MutS family protein [Ancylobacter sp. A5.8]|uniref:Smr/MutS family protein n=1 Tax=Ancylobacter gelatini TaxID=2919920 RepID=UPI001F4D7404|nr:Smr/MutS family protein [Ancylobacter gelatini]MCJ8144437.1 Smr/MutS family protein [Ancylobacter gelatini]
MAEGDEKPSGPRRRRPLRPDEKQLWEHVTRSVREMRPAPKRRPAAPVIEEAVTAAAAPPEKLAKPAKAAPLKPVPPPKTPSPPPLAPLEPKTRRRLSRGAEVDARLDLHGLTQGAAHSRLNAFLRGAQGAGHSLVLVITGKGSSGPAEGAMLFQGEGRGVLRRLVPQWLSAPEMRGIVIGFETAARGHGGEGALYVRVRRMRGDGR